jgi:hypothetical protein
LAFDRECRLAPEHMRGDDNWAGHAIDSDRFGLHRRDLRECARRRLPRLAGGIAPAAAAIRVAGRSCPASPTGNGGAHPHVPGDQPGRVRASRKPGPDPRPGPVPLPAAEQAMHRLPGPCTAVARPATASQPDPATGSHRISCRLLHFGGRPDLRLFGSNGYRRSISVVSGEAAGSGPTHVVAAKTPSTRGMPPVGTTMGTSRLPARRRAAPLRTR